MGNLLTDHEFMFLHISVFVTCLQFWHSICYIRYIEAVPLKVISKDWHRCYSRSSHIPHDTHNTIMSFVELLFARDSGILCRLDYGRTHVRAMTIYLQCLRLRGWWSCNRMFCTAISQLVISITTSNSKIWLERSLFFFCKWIGIESVVSTLQMMQTNYLIYGILSLMIFGAPHILCTHFGDLCKRYRGLLSTSRRSRHISSLVREVTSIW